MVKIDRNKINARTVALTTLVKVDEKGDTLEPYTQLKITIPWTKEIIAKDKNGPIRYMNASNISIHDHLIFVPHLNKLWEGEWYAIAYMLSKAENLVSEEQRKEFNQIVPWI